MKVSTPFASSKAFLLSAFFLCCVIFTQAQTISMGLTTRRTLESDFYGYDMSTTVRGGVSCVSEPLRSHIGSLNAKFLRYPSGSSANWWDWHQGWYVNSPYLPSFDANLTKVPNKLEDFKGLVESAGAIPMFDLNMITSNVRDQIAMLKHADSIGLPVKYIELGNEFYLEGDGADDTALILIKYPTPESYRDTANIWLDSLNKYFPNAKIAAQGCFDKNHNPRRNAWNDAVISTLHGQDAITFHYYFGSAYSDSSETDSSKLDVSMSDVPDWFYQPYKAWTILNTKSLSKVPANEDIWITEYNFSDPQRPTHGTWASGLYTALHSMQLLQDERIKHISCHGVDGQAVFGAFFYDTKGFGYGLNPEANYTGPLIQPPTVPWELNGYGHTMTMMGNSYNKATNASRISFSPNPQVAAVESGITYHYDGLCGYVFTNDTSSRAMIVNVTGDSVILNTGLIFPQGGTYEMRYAPVLSLITGNAAVTTVQGTLTPNLVMRPYSIIRIHAFSVPPPPPTVSITVGGPTTICAGDSVELDAGPGYYSYLWSTGETTRKIRAKITGDFWIHANTIAGGYYASATVHVTVNPVPAKANVIPLGNKSFCQGLSVDLNLGTGVVYSNVTYYWPLTGQTTPAVTVTTPGAHYVIVTDANGCSTPSDSELITVYPLPQASITPVGPTSACYDVDVTLTATGGFTNYLWSNGSFGQTKTLGVSGDYSVTVTDVHNCKSTTAPMNITIWEPPYPTITPSGPTTFCKEANVSLSTLSGYQYQWYKGTVATTGETNQTYYPTLSSNYKVQITDSHGCTKQSDNFGITVNTLSSPGIIVVGGVSICQGASTSLSMASGYSSYLWSTGQTGSSISVNTSGSYTVSISDANGCVATSAPKVVTVNSLPTATITPQGPTAFCAGSDVSLTTQPGFNTYHWSNGKFGQTITANTNGPITVTVTDANGCDGISAPVDLTAWDFPAPTLTANGPTTYCIENSTVLSTQPGYSYVWMRNSIPVVGATNATYAPTQGGTYKVSVSDIHGCSKLSPTLSVTVNQSSTPTISGSASICTGSSSSLTATAGFSSYLWTTSQTTSSINVTSAGSFSVTVTDANGCTATSAPKNVVLNPLPTPVITAQGPTSFCDGGSVILDAGSFSSYSWSNGGSTQTKNMTSSGSYTVTVTNSNGCSATSAPVTVTEWIVTPPVISTNTGATTFCDNAGIYFITPFPWSGYQWQKTALNINGETNQNFIPTASGSYKLVVTDANGCTATSSAISITLVAHPTPVISGSSSICTGSSTTLTCGTFSSYLWSTGQTSSSLNANAAGTYSVTVVNTNGCVGTSANKTITINPVPSPSITAQGAASFCDGGNVTLDAGSGYSSYSWSNGGTLPTKNMTASGSYTVTVTNSSGCSGTSPAFTVTEWIVPTPTISTNTGATTFCDNAGVYLTTPFSGYNYVWQKSNVTVVGATNQNFTPLTGGSYKLILSDSHGCSNTSTAKSITLNVHPVPSITGSTALCGGSSTVLSTGAYSAYTWSTGLHTSSITVFTADTYTVTVTDSKGCLGTSAPKTTTISPVPTPVLTANGPTSFCDGGTVLLDAGSGYNSYSWSNGGTSQTKSITAAGTYTATVTNSAGCSGTTSPLTVNEWILPNPVVTSVGPLTYCSGAGTYLTTIPGFSYQWLKGSANVAGATNQNYTPTANSTYKVKIIDTHGCNKTSTAGIAVTVKALPTATISVTTSTNLCGGQTVKITEKTGTGNTYQWVKDGMNLNGATASTYIASVAGDYNCKVSNTSGCTLVSNTITVTSNCKDNESIIHEKTEPVILIYPNPARQDLHVRLTLNDVENGNCSVELRNMLGAVIYHNELTFADYQIAADITLGGELTGGIYFVIIKQDENIYHSQFVVTKQ